MMEPKNREDSVKGVEESGFYRSATAILAIIGALLGIVYTAGSILSLNLFDSEQLNANIQIIVDRSARMTASIGENTKLESMITTVDSVLQNTVSNGDNLALRDFGGDCNSDKNTDLTVDFSRNNKKNVRRALRKLVPEGHATLVSAIVEASGDFNSYKQFPSTSRKSIIVIAGGGDECYSNASQLIKDRLDWLSDGKNSLRVRYHYIGYDVSEGQKVALAKMAQITGGKLTFADDPIELSSRLQSAITNTDESVDITKIIAASNLSNKRNRMELRGGGYFRKLNEASINFDEWIGRISTKEKEPLKALNKFKELPKSASYMTHAFFVRKQDQGEYEVSIVNEVNRALSHLFTEGGFDVVEIEFLEVESNGLINLEAFKDDFRTGEDIDTTTLVNAVKRLKELGIPYLAVGTLDILFTDIDPVSGYYRTYVIVTGQMKSLVGRFPRTIASVGPYQYAGLGSSPAEARRNALNIAAEKSAAYMVYFCCKF